MAINYTREYICDGFRLRIDDDNYEVHFDCLGENAYIVTHAAKNELWLKLKQAIYDVDRSVSNNDFDDLWFKLKAKGLRTLTYAQVKLEIPDFTVTVKRFADKQNDKRDDNYRDGKAGYVGCTNLPGFAGNGWTCWFNNWDEDGVKEAFYRMKNCLYDEAKKRKERYKKAVAAAEKMAQDAGFEIGSEKLNHFERVLEFESEVGEEKDLATKEFFVPERNLTWIGKILYKIIKLLAKPLEFVCSKFDALR